MTRAGLIHLQISFALPVFDSPISSTDFFLWIVSGKMKMQANEATPARAV